jgi:hypothetical protein
MIAVTDSFAMKSEYATYTTPIPATARQMSDVPRKAFSGGGPQTPPLHALDRCPSFTQNKVSLVGWMSDLYANSIRREKIPACVRDVLVIGLPHTSADMLIRFRSNHPFAELFQLDPELSRAASCHRELCATPAAPAKSSRSPRM